MMTTDMAAVLPECPHLPVPDGELTAACVAVHGEARDAAFYATALTYAQSLWRQGLPARALLLINRAMGCDLTGREPEVRAWPMPYAAVAWLLAARRPDQFIGNPRRHWQHLATRMVAPRKELRTWRAWACWRLACVCMPWQPADELQIAVEGVREPTEDEIAAQLAALGLPGEVALWREALTRAAAFPAVPDEP